jgi:long-chain fatty acid transport protein
MKTIIVAGIALGLASSALAAGFNVDTQSARPTGMATAVTASIDDASAIYYNPAGIVSREGVDIQLGDTVIIPSISFTPASGGSSTNSTTGPVPPPNAYLIYGPSKYFAFGVGFFAPYGLASNWPAGWQGQYLAVDSSLTTYFINPSVAFRPFDWLRIGGGVDIVRGVVDLSRSLNFVESSGSLELGGGAWGVGGNGGVQIDILPKILSIGVHYRSQVRMNFSGSAHFSNVPTDLQTTLEDQNVSTRVMLPDSLLMGISYVPIDQLRLGFDVVWTNWSTINQININFANSSALDQSEAKQWSAGFNYHLGGEFTINQYFQVRAGVLYDPTPSPEDTIGPDLPDANRVNIAAGFGFHYNQFRVDLGYQFVLLMQSKSTLAALPGTYQGNAQVIGLSLGFRM